MLYIIIIIIITTQSLCLNVTQRALQQVFKKYVMNLGVRGPGFKRPHMLQPT